MKKQVAILMLLSIMLMPVVSADIVSDLNLRVNEYNQNADQVPSFLKNLLGNEVIKLVITTSNGEDVYVKAITENGYIISFEEIGAADEIGETLIVRTNEDIILGIMGSEDPLGAFMAAEDADAIIIKPLGFINSIKFGMANVVLKLSQMLGLL